MGQDLQPRTQGTPGQRSEPAWSAVAGTTIRLWLERHHLLVARPAGRRGRLVIVLSALVAMAFGAVITLAFTGANQQASPGARPSNVAQSMTPQQQIQANQLSAATWIKAEVSAGVEVSCDDIMCQKAAQIGFPPGQLRELPSTAPDPLGTDLIIATPAIRSQFGTRLVSVYAPQELARFGSGPEEVDVRYLVPGGAAYFNAQFQANLINRVQAGEQLLTNTNIQISSPAVRTRLRAGQVDPRLLITLATLAHKMTVQLVAFDDSSPGEGFAVPLRGAEIGTTAPGGLSAILSILGQQTTYAPAHMSELKLSNGQQVVTIRYGAPGPMHLPGGA